MRAGTYKTGDLRCFLSGITIMPYPGEVAILAPTGGYRVFLFDSVSDILLTALLIDCASVTSEGVKITGTSSNIKVTECEVRNAPAQGILMTGTISGCEVSGCNIHHNGLDHLDHGVYISSQYAGLAATIKGNVISDNASNGVHAFAGSVDSEYVVAGNLLERNGEVGVGCYCGHARVYNNIIRDTGMRGIAIRFDIKSVLAAFNTIDDSAQQNIEISNLYREVAIELRNDLFLGTGGATTNLDAVPTTESNNLESDGTDIADNGGADIKPVTGSLAIGGGVAVDGITDDYGGNVRANPPTIGAWEA